MYRLFVGNNDTELANLALAHDQNAKLLDYLIYSKETLNGCYYTSLADLNDTKTFFDVCINSSEITYCPSDQWSDVDSKSGLSKMKEWTEYVLYYCSHHISVKNLPVCEKSYLKNFQTKKRKSKNVQIWVAGCSYTSADGVTLDQTWKHHVSKDLELEYTDLSLAGSSITWAADQILRSDIQKNDIVLWQLTGHLRNYVVHESDNKIYHLLPSKFNIDKVKKSFSISYIDSETTVCKNILAIQQVYNFCQKINAKLVILGTLHDWEHNYLHYNIPCFKQIFHWPMELVDKGSDGLHPGPLQHRIYAKKFIELLEKNYGR